MPKDTAVVTFGKYNLLTKGHITVFNKMANLARQRNADMRVYLSHDVKPLSYDKKVEWARKSVPQHKSAIIKSKARNIFDIMVDVHDAGYRNVVVVVGSDRIAEFNKLIPKYNGVDARHGFYEFDNIDVTVAGETRSSSATGVAGLSSTKLRSAAVDGDFEAFAAGVSNELSDREKKRYYEEVRKAMGVRESIASFREYLTEKVTKSDLNQIEKYADKLFAKVGIDVEFTKHFLDRVNDERNKKPISTAELIRIFRETYKKYGKIIPTLGPDAQAVLRDMQTDIHVPFVLNIDKNGELDLVNKTIMRKKGFKTSNQIFAFEEYFNTVAAGKSQSEVFKNPSMKELRELESFKKWSEFRAIITPMGDLYAFDSEFLHQWALANANIPNGKDGVRITVNVASNSIMLSAVVTQSKAPREVMTLLSSRWVSKNLKGFDVIHDFDTIAMVEEKAEYDGRKVTLNDPFRLKDDEKKFGVYVKNDKGNVVIVKFGDADMEIKRDDPERRKSFRARHNCDDKKDKTTAGYWSCKFWEKGKKVSDLLKDSRSSFKDSLQSVAEQIIREK